jgi:hypothetical protein
MDPSDNEHNPYGLYLVAIELGDVTDERARNALLEFSRSQQTPKHY